MMDFNFNKQQLLEKLKSRRVWAKALDAKLLAQHKKEEEAALKKYRNELRAALKQTYKQLINKGNWRGIYLNQPPCPRLVCTMLETAVKAIELDGTKRYHITATGHLKDVHYLLTYDENVKTTAC